MSGYVTRADYDRLADRYDLLNQELQANYNKYKEQLDRLKAMIDINHRANITLTEKLDRIKSIVPVLFTKIEKEESINE